MRFDATPPADSAASTEPFDESPSTPASAITWLNMTGDITITWDDESKDHILELVRQKMAQGYSFFVITPRSLPVLGTKKVKLTSEDQLDKATGVVVPDSQARAMLAKIGSLDDNEVRAAVQKGKARLTLVPKGEHQTTHRAKTAEEVVKSQSVAVRPVVGG